MRRDPGPDFAGIERPLQAQSPRERPAAFGKVKTVKDRVHMCSPAGPPGASVRYDATGRPVDVGNDAQKIRLRRSLSATHTGADRLCATHLTRSLPVLALATPTVRRRESVELPRQSGCRCANQSSGPPVWRFGPPCRSPGTAGSRARPPEPSG